MFAKQSYLSISPEKCYVELRIWSHLFCSMSKTMQMLMDVCRACTGKFYYTLIKPKLKDEIIHPLNINPKNIDVF